MKRPTAGCQQPLSDVLLPGVSSVSALRGQGLPPGASRLLSGLPACVREDSMLSLLQVLAYGLRELLRC